MTDLRRLIRLDVPGLTAQVTGALEQLGLTAPRGRARLTRRRVRSRAAGWRRCRPAIPDRGEAPGETGCATIGAWPAATARRIRLDQLLVERGLVDTRSRAQALVLAGQVRVGEGDAARRDRKSGDLVDRAAAGRASPAAARTSAAGRTSWSPRSTRSGSTRPGSSPRRRRVDRRLHGRPAGSAARPGLRAGRGLRTAGREAPARSAGRVDGADQRPDADAGDASRSRSDLAVVDVSFISLALVLGPVRSVLRDGRGTSSPSSSRSSRPAAAGREGRRRARPGGPSPGAARDGRRGAAALGLGTRARHRLADPRAGGQPRVPGLDLRPGRRCAEIEDRIDGRGGRGMGGHGVTRPAHRVRLQPDERGGPRAARARGRLVPDARASTSGRPRPATSTAARRELPTTDVLVVLGGDGTFLRAAQAVAEVDVPILGINLGKVGFLSKAEAHELEAVLEQLVGGRLHDRGADGARGLDPRRRARRPTDTFTRAQRHRRRPRLAGPRRAAWTSRSTSRTSRRSSPTASSSPARPGSTGLLVLRRRPDPRPAEPEPDRDARSPATSRPSARSSSSPARRSSAAGSSTPTRRSCRIDGREDRRSRSATSSRSGRWNGRIRFVEPAGALPFWDLLRTKVELLPS